MNLHKRNWTQHLQLEQFEKSQTHSQKLLDRMATLAKDHNERVLQEQGGKSIEEIAVLNVGKMDPKKHLSLSVNELMSANIIQCLGTMLDTVVF
jgi:26S proteasome regulatory subunit N11